MTFYVRGLFVKMGLTDLRDSRFVPIVLVKALIVLL